MAIEVVKRVAFVRGARVDDEVVVDQDIKVDGAGAIPNGRLATDCKLDPLTERQERERLQIGMDLQVWSEGRNSQREGLY